MRLALVLLGPEDARIRRGWKDTGRMERRHAAVQNGID